MIGRHSCQNGEKFKLYGFTGISKTWFGPLENYDLVHRFLNQIEDLPPGLGSDHCWSASVQQLKPPGCTPCEQDFHKEIHSPCNYQHGKSNSFL